MVHYFLIGMYCIVAIPTGASKGGLDMLTKVMGLELAPHNVRVGGHMLTHCSNVYDIPERTRSTSHVIEATVAVLLGHTLQ